MSRTRTNIEIDDTYIDVIKRRYGVSTKTEAVDLALRSLASLPLGEEEARAMHGANAIDRLPDDTGSAGTS